MKKLFFPLSLAAALAFTGCSEDFEVAAPYKNVTVVYGILNPKDTAHYVRIQKAFLDENKSAVDMAQVSDSNFYKESDIDVTVQEFSNGKVTDNISLLRVDMAAEGYPKNPAGTQGTFTSPYYAYKFKKTLNVNSRYRLTITNKISGEVISSDSIGIVNGNTGNTNGAFFIGDFTNGDWYIDLEKTGTKNKFSLIGKNPQNAVMQEGVIRFNYLEKNTATGQQERKSVDYVFASSEVLEGTFRLEVKNIDIYTFLAGSIGAAPANIERYMDSCDVFVYAGSKELFYYKQVNLTQSGGLTSDQIKPNYTNLRGNVLGLLASKTQNVRYNVPIGRNAGQSGTPANYSIDSLMANPITRPLNIRGRADN